MKKLPHFHLLRGAVNVPQGSGLVNLTNLNQLSLTDAFMDRSLSIALMFMVMSLWSGYHCKDTDGEGDDYD